MKKILLLLSMVFVMAFSSIAAAANNGALLNGEEKIVDRFVKAIVTTNPAYAGLSGSFSEGLKANIDETKFAEIQKNVVEQYGNVKEYNLIELRKVRDANQATIDQLVYVAAFEKIEKPVAMIFAFETATGKPVLTLFSIGPVEEQQQPAKK